MSVFSLSPDRGTNFDNQIQVYYATLDTYLGSGDFMIIQLFDQTEEVVGRVIDVKNSPTARRATRTEAGRHH